MQTKVTKTHSEKILGHAPMAARFTVSLLVLALGFPAAASGPQHDGSPDAAVDNSKVENSKIQNANLTRHPVQAFRHWIEVGQASWYGFPFQGRKTANGEIYDMNLLTCAHRTLPLGTWLRVTNLKNRKTVVVRVNDRGPFIDKRVVDLSYAAAQAVGIEGVGRVKLVTMHEQDPALAEALMAQSQMPALIPKMGAPGAPVLER